MHYSLTQPNLVPFTIKAIENIQWQKKNNCIFDSKSIMYIYTNTICQTKDNFKSKNFNTVPIDDIKV